MPSQSAVPDITSDGRNGVAVIAKNVSPHLNPSINGHIASVAHVIMAVVAMRAGARNPR